MIEVDEITFPPSETDEYITLKAMIRANPHLADETSLKEWIRHNREQALKLLRRYNKEGMNPGLKRFAFDKIQSQTVPGTLAEVGFIANYIHHKMLRPALAMRILVKNF